MTLEQAPVLVVGGRTTGMMMAAELARRAVAGEIDGIIWSRRGRVPRGGDGHARLQPE